MSVALQNGGRTASTSFIMNIFQAFEGFQKGSSCGSKRMVIIYGLRSKALNQPVTRDNIFIVSVIYIRLISRAMGTEPTVARKLQIDIVSEWFIVNS